MSKYHYFDLFSQVSGFSIQVVKFFRTKEDLMKPSETVFKAILITRGRKTGKEHAVELRTVYYNNKFYFSRRDSQSDWLKNAQAIPDVQIQYNGKTFLGIAMIVTDKNLQKKFPN